MTTLTLYRPVGTAEAALIAEADWTRFPPMPKGAQFYAYSQPLGDPRKWPAELEDMEMLEALENGQAEVVQSWKAWGNSPDEFIVVWFEVDERLQPSLHGPLDVSAVNQALIGPIEVCARYGPMGIWKHPNLLTPS